MSTACRVHAVVTAGQTGRLAAIVDRSGERSFVTERGAADLLTAADVRPAWLRGIGVLHLPAYSLFNQPLGEAAAQAARLARGRGALLSVDLASRGPLLTTGRRAVRASLAALAPELLFATSGEAVALAGASDPASLLHLATVVVVKEGPEGCLVLWRGRAADGDGLVERLEVATTPLAAPDTTGAGDAFAAGFLWSILGAGGTAGAAGSGGGAGAGAAGGVAGAGGPAPPGDHRFSDAPRWPGTVPRRTCSACPGVELVL